ncbi:hypothetical protein [Streptomyces sp. NPDC051636]|uniref:hypothetical protein n=1 Tax=Streptomyces sp. NPDC051636 TaxID=3365663 RepID=UPI0037BBDE77
MLTRKGLEDGWTKEVHCTNQREPGMVDVVWSALMDNDPIGRTWGEALSTTGRPVGVSRFWNFLT